MAGGFEISRANAEIAKIGVHDHACLFFTNEEERVEVVIPAVRYGLERGEKCLYITDETDADELSRKLDSAGIDTVAAAEAGSLAITGKNETYLKDGGFDIDRTLEYMKEQTEAAKEAGFIALRFIGEMSWAVGNEEYIEKLVEFESRQNSFLSENDALQVCQYDQTRFRPDTIMKMIGVHPMIIYKNLVAKNFYFIPPEETTEERAPVQEVPRLLKNIVEYEKNKIEHMEAEETAKTRARQQAVIAQLGQSVIKEIPLGDYMDLIVKRVAETLEVDFCRIIEMLPGEQELLLIAGTGWKEGDVGRASVSVETESQAGYTLLADEPVIVDDMRTETRFSPDDVLVEHKAVSGICAAIGSRRRPFGVLGAYTQSRRIFTEDDISFIQAVVNVLAMAIERSDMEKERAEVRRLNEEINKINMDISSTFDIQEIMNRVSASLTETIGTESGGILLLEDGAWVARCLSGALPQELLGRAFSDEQAAITKISAETKKPAFSQDTFYDDRTNKDVMKSIGIRAFLSIPLIVKDEVIGALVFIYHSTPMYFSDTLIDFASKVAALLSLALENARLFAAERRIADVLQESLLKVPEEIPGIDSGYLYRSATEEAKVGGDFYDLFELGNSKIGIVAGDVSGKGIEAATLTSTVKNTVKAYAYQGLPSSEVIAKTNGVMIKESVPRLLVSVFFGILDKVSGKLEYCSAGHPPPRIRRKNGRTESLNPNSSVIGIFPEMEYASNMETIEEGDLLVTYTDGLIEARQNGDLYGETRLVGLLGRLDPMPTRQVPDRLFSEVEEFCRGNLNDDVVVMAVSYKR